MNIWALIALGLIYLAGVGVESSFAFPHALHLHQLDEQEAKHSPSLTITLIAATIFSLLWPVWTLGLFGAYVWICVKFVLARGS